MSYVHYFLQSLRSIPKSFFSIQDVEKFYPGKSHGSILVALTRLVKKNILQKICRGYFTFDIHNVDWESFACMMRKKSYISLEYALYHYGFIDQIPETLTLVTPQKSSLLNCHGKILEYSHINPNLYFGYEMIGNALIAVKEKALLDELYLVSLRKRHFTLQNQWFKNIDRKLFQKWLRAYPPFVQESAREFLFK